MSDDARLERIESKLNQAGVSWGDTQAVKDVIKRKLMSNEFSALRVWEGTY